MMSEPIHTILEIRRDELKKALAIASQNDIEVNEAIEKCIDIAYKRLVELHVLTDTESTDERTTKKRKEALDRMAAIERAKITS